MDNETLTIRLVEAEKDISDLKTAVTELTRGIMVLVRNNNDIMQYINGDSEPRDNEHPDEPDTGAYL